jgi:putative addiction module component (TIGR02574 family)
MTTADLKRHAFQLSVEEQLDLAQALWEHASPPADPNLSPELVELLAARQQHVLKNPDAGSTWEEVKARLRGA